MTFKIEGFAIISEDGMLADANGVMPPALVIEADQAQLAEGLDRADAIIHGRNSHEGQRNSPRRKRLIATRHVKAIEIDEEHAHALLWNPAGVPFEKALERLGVTGGTIAVLGGTDLFGMFLPAYDVFHLTRVPDVRLPGGRPIFPQVQGLSAEDVLRAAGLHPGPVRMLDTARRVSVVTWRRKR